MGVDAVHFNTAMTGVQDYNTMKHVEDSKGFLNQTNFRNEFSQKIDNKLNQVQEKDKSENRQQKFDAKEKGNNSYTGDGGKRRSSEENKKKEVRMPYLGGGFDMKI